MFIERVNSRITELDKELASMKEEKARLQKDVNIIADRLSSFKDNFHTLTIEEKRTLIKLMVKKIVWDGKDLHIFIDGE